MSRNTSVIVECKNCGKDIPDGTVANRLNRRLCDTCSRAYNLAISDSIRVLKKYGTCDLADKFTLLKDLKEEW